MTTAVCASGAQRCRCDQWARCALCVAAKNITDAADCAVAPLSVFRLSFSTIFGFSAVVNVGFRLAVHYGQ